MSVPTPPAVSDAMREAVARALYEHDNPEPRLLWPPQISPRLALKYRARAAVALGPIASEIARLTRESAEYQQESLTILRQSRRSDEKRLAAEKRCRALEDQEAELRRSVALWQDKAAGYAARSTAAEAETARLRAALKLAENPLSYRHATDPNGPGSIAVARALEAVRAALSSQEKTDA